MQRSLNRLPDVYAWELSGLWYYTTSQALAPPIASLVHCYEADGRIVLYWPNDESGDLIWDAQCED